MSFLQGFLLGCSELFGLASRVCCVASVRVFWLGMKPRIFWYSQASLGEWRSEGFARRRSCSPSEHASLSHFLDLAICVLGLGSFKINALKNKLECLEKCLETSVDQLGNNVANLVVDNGIGFSDADLTPAGKNHNKALHISIECKGITLSHVLIDNGSSLNVLPKAVLDKLDCKSIELKPSDIVVRAYDGAKSVVHGEVVLPIKVGPQVFNTTCYVMNICPAYSCLLGRPWIHGASVVASSLHQKLRYPIECKIVTVCGEEEYIISSVHTFRYVEMDSEFFETPSQSFEVVPPTSPVLKPTSRVPKVIRAPPAMISLKDAQAAVEDGGRTGWGQLIDVPYKSDKFGLGFSSEKIVKDQIYAVEDVDSDCDLDSWIFPTIGDGLNNWKAEDTIPISFSQESISILDPVDNNSATVNYGFKNPIYQVEDGSEEDCEVSGELARLLLQEEKTIQPHEESIEIVNLGTEVDKKEVKIGAGLENSVKERLIQMLHDYVEIFAWSYEDMPGLDTDIVVHRLPMKEDCHLVKQKVRHMRPEMSEKIKAEVMKQFNAGFLAVTSYPQWVANVVPVPKKDGKV
ncbi:hypothetical protein KIW84_077045 [Lathyrus oleraceus]|uniref:Uncharacterized protein n=1 Tax=Pisum sativum TaxID=3888 RepID=A0A9D4VZU6_PEA|nr:hypothetical protein KIW84_077045 [Pisum sativum]